MNATTMTKMDVIKVLCNVKKCKYEFKEDTDHLERPCEIQLCVRNVASLNGVEHYALSFKWADREVIYEANDVGGYLVPSWYEGPPDPRQEWKLPGDCRFEIKCSPQLVNLTAKNLPINGEVFILSRMNCQTWACALITKFKQGAQLVKSGGLLNAIVAPLGDLCYASGNLRMAFMGASFASQKTGDTTALVNLSNDPRVRASSIVCDEIVPEPQAVTAYRVCTASSLSAAPIEIVTELGFLIMTKIRQIQFALEDRTNYRLSNP